MGGRLQMTRFRSAPRGALLLLAVVVILALGLFIRQLPGDWTLTTANKELLLVAKTGAAKERSELIATPLFDRSQWRLQSREAERGQSGEKPAQSPRQQQIRVLFEHGANLMRQRQFPQARKALEMLVELAPKLPEGYVNLGFVLYELGEIESSINAFTYASQLNPYQSNAYYGAALGYERQSDYEAALGNMRSFIHLSQADNAFLPRARAALWEWEQIIDLRRQAGASVAAQASQENMRTIVPSVVSDAVQTFQEHTRAIPPSVVSETVPNAQK